MLLQRLTYCRDCVVFAACGLHVGHGRRVVEDSTVVSLEIVLYSLGSLIRNLLCHGFPKWGVLLDGFGFF